ncbi:MAG: ferritin-like domain-containing protein [Solirubrobacteraceae bacterium]
MRRATRRELLVSGAGAAVGGTALVRPGAAGAAAGASTVAETPAERLHRLLSVELLLLFCYQHVLGASILKPHARQVVTPFLAHEESHVQALTQMLQSLGGRLPSAPPSVVTADRRLAHRGVSERLGQLTGSGDALRLLLDVERVVTGAYFVALIKLQDTALIRLAAQIMGAEAQHEALIGELLNHGDAQRAVPYGLIQGTQ